MRADNNAFRLRASGRPWHRHNEIVRHAERVDANLAARGAHLFGGGNGRGLSILVAARHGVEVGRDLFHGGNAGSRRPAEFRQLGVDVTDTQEKAAQHDGDRAANGRRMFRHSRGDFTLQVVTLGRRNAGGARAASSAQEISGGPSPAFSRSLEPATM
jgi:hypothetical protein